MSTVEYYQVSGHLFEVVPTQGNGLVGFLEPNETYPHIQQVKLEDGSYRYFTVKNQSTRSFIEVRKPADNVSKLKSA